MAWEAVSLASTQIIFEAGVIKLETGAAMKVADSSSDAVVARSVAICRDELDISR